MIKIITAMALTLALNACVSTRPHTVTPPERLFLQQVSAHGAVLKWRGGDAGSVCYGTSIRKLERAHGSHCVAGQATALGHMEASLTGLAPDTHYYYSLGDMTREGWQFRTPPDANQPPGDGNTHILIVGDSGTQTELDRKGEASHAGEAAEVLRGFAAYNRANGDEAVDLFLALGDNAYLEGSDAQWQGAFFDIYPGILATAPVLPTIGNHEMGSGKVPCVALERAAQVPEGYCEAKGISHIPYGGVSTSADPASYDGNGDFQADGTGMPYLDIFSLPAAGESGGVPSGTEQYYSVDYGNVHIVSLDSQLSARDDDQRAKMKTWLEMDLAANDRDWTIVIFHHPPYTKGANHDSDTADTAQFGIDRPEFDMRVEFTPVFESYGVDVVYSGHSHSYERSYYLRGHTGVSDTFVAARYAELNGAGEPSLGYGQDEYHQLSPTSLGVDDRVVYSVAGSSGKSDSSGGALGDDWLQHEAHVPQSADDLCGDGLSGCRHGLAVKGAVVIDASASSLRARFIGVNGEVLDQFTINR